MRSYGTEDRETQYPIAPQNQVYDYILFRGSDIKDIRVVNNVAPIPQDPAIMQMQMHPGQQMMGGVGPAGGVGGFPGQQQPQQFQPQQQMGQQLIGGGAGSIAMMGGGAGALGGFNAMGGLGGPLGPGGMGGMAPGASMSNLHKTKQTSELYRWSVVGARNDDTERTDIGLGRRGEDEGGLALTMALDGSVEASYGNGFGHAVSNRPEHAQMWHEPQHKHEQFSQQYQAQPQLMLLTMNTPVAGRSTPSNVEHKDQGVHALFLCIVLVSPSTSSYSFE